MKLKEILPLEIDLENKVAKPKPIRIELTGKVSCSSGWLPSDQDKLITVYSITRLKDKKTIIGISAGKYSKIFSTTDQTKLGKIKIVEEYPSLKELKEKGIRIVLQN